MSIDDTGDDQGRPRGARRSARAVAADLDRIRHAAPRVVVVGDFLLDGWWRGRIERVAREAPAPVVDVLSRDDAPGGAANTAVNLAALGAEVVAVGLVGDDAAGERIRAGLREAGVDVTRLRAVAGAMTTTKVRVSADDQIVVRIDETRAEPWPDEAMEGFLDDALDAVADADALLVCDYGSILDDRVVERMASAPHAPLCVVDAHDPARWRALGPDIVTPNAAETERVVGDSLGAAEERVVAAVAYEDRILSRTGASAAVVTLDRSGTVLLRAGHRAQRTHAHPTLEKQASGAGDVFVAALTVARAAGAALDDAADVAQRAADVAVRKTGTCLCSLDELEEWLDRPSDASLDLDRLADALDAHRREGRRIVFTNGCFDVLHRGHTTSLRQAKKLGDVLVVAINSDASVRRLKGPDRPVNSASDRAAVLADLACVDYVTVFADETPRALIRRLRPDVYAKGGDYTPEMLAETADVRAAGGEVAILDYVPEHSTTEVIGRIRGGRPNDAHPVGI